MTWFKFKIKLYRYTGLNLLKGELHAYKEGMMTVGYLEHEVQRHVTLWQARHGIVRDKYVFNRWLFFRQVRYPYKVLYITLNYLACFWNELKIDYKELRKWLKE